MIINDIREKSKDEKKNRDLKKTVFIIVVTSLFFIGSSGAIKLFTLENNEQPSTLEYTGTYTRPVTKVEKKTIPQDTSDISDTKENKALPTVPVSPNEPQSGMMYVGSRGGTTYYPQGCAAAKRISVKNKIWFESVQEAERLGYKFSKQCQKTTKKILH